MMMMANLFIFGNYIFYHYNIEIILLSAFPSFYIKVYQNM